MATGKFNAEETWRLLMREADPVNVFMAVPTVYNNLVRHFDESGMSAEKVKERLGRYRLMISGSAALPAAQMQRWEQISGQRLLERFGMTETGFPLSNPYRPVSSRLPGRVGSPMPGASIALLDLDN